MAVRYVYFAHDGAPSERVKIGISINPRWRVKTLHCHLLFAIPCEYRFARELEQTIHAELVHLRAEDRGWREGWTEWFTVDERLSSLIQRVRRTGLWPWDYTEVIL